MLCYLIPSVQLQTLHGNYFNYVIKIKTSYIIIPNIEISIETKLSNRLLSANGNGRIGKKFETLVIYCLLV